MSAAEPQAQPPSAGHSPYPGVVSPDAPLQGTASLRVLSAGYLGRRFASTVTFVRDGAALIEAQRDGEGSVHERRVPFRIASLGAAQSCRNRGVS